MDDSASTPEDDITQAREALAEGDLQQAAHHVAAALGVDPNRREWLQLLDQVIETAVVPLELFPIDETPVYCTVAAHAYVLARQGSYREAIDLLLQTIHVRPDVAYVNWAIRWLQQAPAGSVDMERLGWFVSSLAQNVPALMSRDEGGKATLDRMAKFIQVVRQSHRPDGRFLAVSVSLLRRLGYRDEALELAKEAYAGEPGFHTAIAVAVAHETRKELEPALAAYRDALRFQPDDLSVRLSMADLLWAHDKFDEAQKLYDEVLEREPEHPWALPSSHFLRFQRQGAEKHRDQLLTLAEEQPDNDRTQWLARQAMPYFGYLPEPSDATTNVMRRFLEGKEAEQKLDSLALTSLEAPSNYLAFDTLRNVPVTVEKIQTPDPRVPRCKVEYLLWRYDELRPKVAVPPPNPSVAWAVVEIAGQAYQLEVWSKQAARLARQMQPNHAVDLLATMVYPPRPADVKRPWGWVYRVQMAAALVLAHLDDGWRGSVRRKALLSLANGPMDWTTDAALIALTMVAMDDEEAAEEIAELFREMRAELPTDGPVCYFQALMYGSLRLPNLDADERTEIRQRLRKWHQVDEADSCYDQAAALANQGELDQAVAQLDEAVRLRPNFAEAWHMRAALHADRNDEARALADYTEAIRLRPEAAGPYLGRGQLHLKHDRVAEALADFEEAVRRAPDDWHGYYRRGLARAQAGDPDQALADFTAAAERGADSPWVFIERGQLYAEQKRFAEAVADFTSAIERDPQSAAAYMFRGCVHADTGEHSLAVLDFTEQIRLDPKRPAAYNFRAASHYHQGHYADALADHQQALTLDAANPRTCNYVAWILATCPDDPVRDGRRALELATRACELTGWKQAYCLDTLAAAYAECGQFAQAVEWSVRAVELTDPSEKEDYGTRLELYRAGKPYRGK